MQMSPHVEALLRDLAAVARLGDPASAVVVGRVGAALDSAFRLRLLQAVTEAAGEITLQLPNGRVEVRLEEGDPVPVFVETAEEPRAFRDDDVTAARITLRLPEGLKAGVERAAAMDGMSVNAWLLQVIRRNLEPHPRRSRVGNRLTGFARS
ncbi:hypothetical protein BH20ACT24_BH20ACT24_16010 [soil metagenome]